MGGVGPGSGAAGLGSIGGKLIASLLLWVDNDLGDERFKN